MLGHVPLDPTRMLELTQRCGQGLWSELHPVFGEPGVELFIALETLTTAFDSGADIFDLSIRLSISYVAYQSELISSPLRSVSD